MAAPPPAPSCAQVRHAAPVAITGVARETITMRTDAERKRRLQAAADLARESLTSFVLSAADERAERILAQSRTTVVPVQFFDDFFDSLAPEPTTALVEAAERHRRLVRRAP